MVARLCVHTSLFTSEPSDARIRLPRDPLLVLGLGIEDYLFSFTSEAIGCGPEAWGPRKGSWERPPWPTTLKRSKQSPDSERISEANMPN